MKFIGYFRETRGPRADALRGVLWRSPGDPSDQQCVLEQYRLYAESADRIAERRALANTFFLGLNTAVLTLLGAFWKDPPEASPWLALFPLLALVAQCFVWFAVIRSYRQLNSGKWAVVGELEKRLPSAPWAAEWTALAEGRDPAIYWPLTHVEKWIPAIFAVAYLGGFAVLVATG